MRAQGRGRRVVRCRSGAGGGRLAGPAGVPAAAASSLVLGSVQGLGARDGPGAPLWLGKRGPSAGTWGMNERVSRGSAAPRELWAARAGASRLLQVTRPPAPVSSPPEPPRAAVQGESAGPAVGSAVTALGLSLLSQAPSTAPCPRFPCTTWARPSSRRC